MTRGSRCDFGFTDWVEDQFTYVSERAGWRQLYLVSRAGEAKKVTRGKFDIIRMLKLDAANGIAYFTASPKNATERYLYRINLDGTGLKRLSPAKQRGSHSYSISPDAKWAVHTFSSIQSPPVTQLIKLPAHEPVRTLEDNAALRAKVKTLAEPKREFFKIDIGDGVQVDAYAVLPPKLDRSKNIRSSFTCTASRPGKRR